MARQVDMTEPTDQPTVADLVRAYRASLGLTQRGLAARWSCSVRAVEDIEQGLSRINDGALRDLLMRAMASVPVSQRP